MKFFVLLAAVMSGFLLVSGCGSTSSNSNSNADVTVVNANPPANSNLVPYVPPGSESINSNALSANANNPAASDPAAKPNARYMTFPAPDDSEYSTVMNQGGMPVETRVFRSDRQISKVVRTWQSVEKQEVTIHLKNGKVVKVAGDKIKEIRSVPVSVFYEAAGLRAPVPPAASQPGKTESKPSSQ